MGEFHRKISADGIRYEEKPTPDNFCEFMPWACNQLQADAVLNITKLTNECILGIGKKDKQITKEKSKHQITSRTDTGENNQYRKSLYFGTADEAMVKIIAIYDNLGNLLHIKFEKNKTIPRVVFKILEITLPYHLELKKVSINGGINAASFYELGKLLNSTITEICLDGTASLNYAMLLENDNRLTNLSLSRCKIDDTTVKKISEQISAHSASSKTLALLNLASNKITDEGAKHIAQALRFNDTLVYLNVSDNWITDEGAEYILNVLKAFRMTDEEVITSKRRFFEYCKRKHKYELNVDRNTDCKKSGQKKMKSNKAVPTPTTTDKKVKPIGSLFIGSEEFDSFAPKNTFQRNDLTYRFGNNRLAYINLSYNNISYLTVKHLLNVLKYQKRVDRKPPGLINVAVEGNCIPVTCVELKEIDDILQMATLHMNNDTKLTDRKKRSKHKFN